jgi:hypothetical protein
MVSLGTPEINVRKKVPSEIPLVGTLFLTAFSREPRGTKFY